MDATAVRAMWPLITNAPMQQCCDRASRYRDTHAHTHTCMHGKTERISRRISNGYDLTWKSKNDFWSPVEAADYVCGGLDVCIRF